MIQNGNKRIAVNTAIIYVRMVVVTLIALCTTRYVLEALGVSDYGLFNVVGGLVSMLNIISIAMHTTTRRYINVEMGKPNGDLNKVFNICFVLHVGFALFILFLAETIGLYYICHFLNVAPDKLNDAIFVFQFSTFVSVLGIINVPYQGLLDAYEKFGTMALIDFSTTLLKIPLVILLIHYSGNALRFYAVGVCSISFVSFVLYQYICHRQYSSIIKLKRVWDKKLYREILIFNNYTALGAASYLGRSQGATMLINYFFGTLVNGAFAIAYQVENFIIMFVNNLSTASDPQITQSYSSGDSNRTFYLVEKTSKYSILIMLLLIFPINVELEFLLTIWLGKIPEGTLLFCRWIFVSLFIRSLASGVPSIIQATGKVKGFQLIVSSLSLIGLPISFLFLYFGMSVEWVIIVFAAMDLVCRGLFLVLLKRLTGCNLVYFTRTVFLPVVYILLGLFIYIFGFSYLTITETSYHVLSLFVAIFYVTILSFFVGLTTNEKKVVIDKFLVLIRKNHK